MKIIFKLFLVMLLSISAEAAQETKPERVPVVGLVDLHAHIASHLAYGFMLFGGDPESASDPDLTYDHAFRQHMNLDLLKASGVKIYVMAALVNVFGITKGIAEKQVLEQLDYVEKLVQRHPKEFAWAKNPEEARRAIDEGKMVFVHALEGAEFLIDSKEDAKRWADRGVAMMGPIHLVDNNYGDASIMSGVRAILNWKGWLKRFFSPSKRAGLNEKGEAAIKNMFKAGIIVDTAHMAEQSLVETLDLAKKASIPIVMSHGFMRKIRNEERGLTDEQITAIYEGGGMLAVTGGGNMIHPLKDEASSMRLAKDYCEKSIDDYLLHVRYLEGRLGTNSFALGLGTDFNGFVPGFRPKFGELGCQKEGGVTKFDTVGMQGPQMIPGMMEDLKMKYVGIESYNKGAEAFLTIWEKAIKSGQQINPNF